MSAIAVVVTPLEAGTPVVVICRDKFVAHKIALTRMESLICALHLPEPTEQSEQSHVQAHSAWQGMSRAGPRLGSVPSLGISARYDSVLADRAETLPSLVFSVEGGWDPREFSSDAKLDDCGPGQHPSPVPLTVHPEPVRQ
jgi:hypothetical protein